MGDGADLVDMRMDREGDALEEPTSITCKYCGAENLHWNDDSDRWMLVTASGQVHHCPNLPKPFKRF